MTVCCLYVKLIITEEYSCFMKIKLFMNILDNLKSRFLNYLFLNNTKLGNIIWIFSAILLIYFLYFVLHILLSPFGFLNQFIAMLTVVCNLIIAIAMHSSGFKLFDVLNKMKLISHIAMLSVMSLICVISTKYIWENKEEYLK